MWYNPWRFAHPFYGFGFGWRDGFNRFPMWGNNGWWGNNNGWWGNGMWGMNRWGMGRRFWW